MRSLRSVSLLPVIFLILSLSGSTHAAEKFQRWFTVSAEKFDSVSRNTCNVTYNIFQDAYREAGGAAWIDLGVKLSPIYGYCRDHVSCIYENTSEADKATLTSAGVVLGVLPTLLAVLSPSIAELALLSVHRPLLSTLISIGSPGVLQTRVFEYEDPAQTLDLPDATNAVTRLALALGPWSPAIAAVVSVCEYLIVLGSGANILYLAVQLGTRAILSWGCTRSWPPMLWAIFPLVIHAIGAHSYRLTLDPSTRHQKAPVMLDKQGSFFTQAPTPPRLPTPPSVHDAKSHSTTNIALLPLASASIAAGQNLYPMPTPRRTGRRSPWALIKRELLPCAAHPDTVINNRLPLDRPSTRAKVGIALNCLAGFLSCMHLLYGTMVFASFNFIDVRDTVGQIAMRFLLSGVFCRLVVLVEIAGMRGARLRLVAEEKAKAAAAASNTGPGMGWRGGFDDAERGTGLVAQDEQQSQGDASAGQRRRAMGAGYSGLR